MSTRDPDLRIDAWLREELDAVPEPTRALQSAVDAAAITPQRRGRFVWLRRLLGLDTSTTQLGRRDRPEVVLTPGGHDGQGGAGALRREGTSSLPILVAVLLVATILGGAATWMTLGPGRELLGGSSTEGTVVPEQPRQPLDPPGPDRVIVVDPVDGHFGTVAGAVTAAAAGDRIELRPGTYTAGIVIDKDIAIVGAGDREAIIVMPAPLPEGVGERDQLRTVFTLKGSDATLEGMTVRGASHGTAVVIDGGSPTLDDLVVDPEGEMRTSSPTQPREALAIDGGASPTIRDSVLTSLSHIGNGSSPLFEGVTVQGACMLIEGEGTSPVVRGTTFQASECPGFSISVAKGAHVLVEASPVNSLSQNAGIRVANEGSSAEITGTDIIGGTEGLYVGPGAGVLVYRTNVRDAEIGIRVLDAELRLQEAGLIGNEVGLRVGGDSYLETSGTTFCGNAQSLDLSDGARVPLDQNDICIDGTMKLAVEPGT